MTRSREIANDEGYTVVHSLTDCVFMHKPGVTRADAMRLSRRITNEVGVPMDVEGVYKWLVLLPSKTHSPSYEKRSGGPPSYDHAGVVGVPNRYYGKFEDGTVKVRDIEVQRHSTPEWIYNVQQGMLDVFAEADSAEDFLACIPHALQVAKSAAISMRRREIAPEELGLMLQTRMGPDDYVANTNTKAALKALKTAGVERKPGEYVKYVVTRRRGPWRARVMPVELAKRDQNWISGKTQEYDVGFYVRLLARSVETMLSPFGYDEEALYRWLMGETRRPRGPKARRFDVTPVNWIRPRRA
jgi:DNA polymerase-2